MIMHDWNNEKEDVILLIHPMLSSANRRHLLLTSLERNTVISHRISQRTAMPIRILIKVLLTRQNRSMSIWLKKISLSSLSDTELHWVGWFFYSFSNMMILHSTIYFLREPVSTLTRSLWSGFSAWCFCINIRKLLQIRSLV